MANHKSGKDILYFLRSSPSSQKGKV